MPTAHMSQPIVGSSNPMAYVSPKPYMIALAYMVQTVTPHAALNGVRVVEMMTTTLTKFKEEMVSAMHPQEKGVYIVAPQAVVTTPSPPRSDV